MKKLEAIRMSLGDQWEGVVAREEVAYLLLLADLARVAADPNLSRMDHVRAMRRLHEKLEEEA